MRISLLAILLASGCSRHGEFVFHGKTMGTAYTVRLYSDTVKLNFMDENKIEKTIQSELDQIDKLMSNWKKESDTVRFNDWEANKPFPASKDFITVIQKSKEVHLRTFGAFDPTLGPLIELWGFGAKNATGKIPSAQKIKESLDQVGFEKIRIENNSIIKHKKEIQLNLSAIAKGYAVDRTYLALVGLGFNRVMVEVGGEVRTGNPPPGKEYWKIGIEKPNYSGEQSIQKIIKIKNISVATSGDYRNFFRSENRIYSHIIDPRTGMPEKSDIISASIIGPDCAIADALATSMLVLGSKKGMEVMESYPGYEGFFIRKGSSEKMEEIYSSGMHKYLGK